MTTITKEEMAERLNGREYRSEVSPQDRTEAKASGLVIVYGASDDLIEFDGALYDEGDCYEGGTFYVDAEGLLDRSQIDEDDDAIAAFLRRKAAARRIEACWLAGDGTWTWTYQTDIPHATFEIIDDGDRYCRGIVFSIEDLREAATDDDLARYKAALEHIAAGNLSPSIDFAQHVLDGMSVEAAHEAATAKWRPRTRLSPRSGGPGDLGS